MLIDSHAHLFNEDFQNDLPGVIHRARESGIDAIVVPGTTLETSREAVELAEKHDFLFACVGYHPHEASRATDENLAEIERLSSHEKVVAIGEIGLDFHYDFAPRDKQQHVYKSQLDIACRRDLPVVIHTRESTAEAIQAVREVVEQSPKWQLGENGGEAKRGVFHCFSGNADEAKEVFALGFYVSYGGMVTFKNSKALETLQTLGLSRVLLETDSPYLAPVPMRGKKNEPANMIHTAKKISESLNIPLDRVAELTSRNARILFGLKLPFAHMAARQ